MDYNMNKSLASLSMGFAIVSAGFSATSHYLAVDPSATMDLLYSGTTMLTAAAASVFMYRDARANGEATLGLKETFAGGISALVLAATINGANPPEKVDNHRPFIDAIGHLSTATFE